MASLLRRSLMAAALAAPLGAPAQAQSPTEVRIMWYSDGNEGEVVRDLLDRFEKANPDIKVALDRVPYKTIVENLPAMAASGQAPDMARITDLGGMSPYLLDVAPLVKDRAYWEANFGATLPWLRPPGTTTGIYGMMTQLTVVLPIINETLFEQAGIPVPGPKATWEEWGRAAKAVAAKTNAPIPVAMDRSGHRMAGGAISYGAKFFNGDEPALVDDGFKAFTKLLFDWHRDGTMSKQIWGSVGGAAYRGANEEFANGQVVMYVSGTWQFPQFAKTIGNGFDWRAAANPCGVAGCSGMPGGAALVGFKTTKNPQQVARVLDYLASEPVHAEFLSRTLFLPAHAGLAAKGVAYKAETPQVQKSLAVAFEQVKALMPLAYRLQGYSRNRALFVPMVVRLNQAIAGEMSLEDAWARMTSDVAEAMKAQATR